MKWIKRKIKLTHCCPHTTWVGKETRKLIQRYKSHNWNKLNTISFCYPPNLLYFKFFFFCHFTWLVLYMLKTFSHSKITLSNSCTTSMWRKVLRLVIVVYRLRQRLSYELIWIANQWNGIEQEYNWVNPFSFGSTPLRCLHSVPARIFNFSFYTSFQLNLIINYTPMMLCKMFSFIFSISDAFNSANPTWLNYTCFKCSHPLLISMISFYI